MLLIPTRDKDTADAPKTMAAWTGVVGPFTDGDMEEALSNHQAELDERGREAQHRFYVDSGEQGALIAGARTTVTAWIGVLVGVVAPIIILLSPLPILGLAATLAFVLAGLGPGIMSHIDTGDPYAQAALTFVLSMAEFALAATIMIWLASWHPTWLLLLAVPSVLSCLQRLYAGHVAAVISGAKS